MATDPDEDARRLAAESYSAHDPTGWFERLYVAAAEGRAVVPWDRDEPNRLLVEWAAHREPPAAGRRALVIGSGLGDDAEYVSHLGFDTAAFDIAATAVQAARRRFPDSDVDYRPADLLHPPDDWLAAFDLVVESMTVQSLPEDLHPEAIVRVRAMVAPGGTLLVIAAARTEDEPPSAPPWPLTKAEVETFAADGLQPVRIEALRDGPELPVSRWRAELRRSDP